MLQGQSFATPEEKEINIFASLTEQALAVLEELDMKDYLKIQKEYEGFLA